MSLHYGPWTVTITDGDVLLARHEVYASTENEAVAEVMEFSEFTVRGPEDEDRFEGPVYIDARRVS